jgi:hypothetical protein
MAGGRPKTPFDQDIADQILEAIAGGVGLINFLDDNKETMPSYPTVRRWLREEPEFLSDYARAREDQGDYDSDLIRECVLKLMAGGIDPNNARAAMDGLKWNAARRQPKKYGDKVEIATTGTVQVSHTLTIDHLSIDELDVLEKALGGA